MVTAAGLTVLLVVEPAQTVHPDLGRLYASAPAGVWWSLAVTVGCWLAAVAAWTLGGVALGRWVARRVAGAPAALVLTAHVSVLVLACAGVAASIVVPGFGTGRNLYEHASDLGIAPPSSTWSPVTVGMAVVGAALSVLAAACAAVAVAATGRRRR
ncbi:hypothetical protein MN205_07645 [Kineococcus sp. TRM81007]|uniref:hypothetical protein n=1 Tax=Kineococcus sp. TRM81007 TaxID=2925831 RepID=UPI001F56CEC2|nr:hypothetical protein [Kineococcus sp. TRM81007]MCI2238367.1 hypothetical protein [Kineococcus sp. TRM81007]